MGEKSQDTFLKRTNVSYTYITLYNSPKGFAGDNRLGRAYIRTEEKQRFVEGQLLQQEGKRSKAYSTVMHIPQSSSLDSILNKQAKTHNKIQHNK